MYDLDGKVALVTGTSNKRGMGCAIALRLAREGADVVITDKSKGLEQLEPWDKEAGWRGLDGLVAEIEALGRRALAVIADISNSAEVYSLVDKAVNQFSRIDILVNNAALITKDIGRVHVVDFDEKVWKRTLDINLSGTFYTCKAVAQQMIKRKQGGKIINISSIMGKQPSAGRASYSSSKAGIIALTQTLALELAPYNIHVNAICPGAVATWGSKGKAIYEAMKQGLNEEEAIGRAYKEDMSQIPLARVARPEEIAAMVAFLASNQSDYVTGQAINVNGGWLMAH